MGVGDQTSDTSQDSEGFDFEVGAEGGEAVFGESDQGVVLLVDV